jgi:hypothetical protein
MKVVANNERFVIVDDQGKIIDDAQGWGYKTKEKAHKAMWYKFKGGKQKIVQQKQTEKNFFSKHKGLRRFLDDLFEYNLKEIARGEITEDDLLSAVKEEFGIDLPKEYL